MALAEIEMTVRGIEVVVVVTSWETYDPGKLSGPPEDCYPPEGGHGDWDLKEELDGPPLTKEEIEQIEETLFDYMEGDDR